MLKNLKIGAKISVGFAVTLLFLIALSAVVLISAANTNRNLDAIKKLSDFQQNASLFVDHFTEARIGANVIYTLTDTDAYDSIITGYDNSKSSLSLLREYAEKEDILRNSLSEIDSVSASLDNWKNAIDKLNSSNLDLNSRKQELFRVTNSLINSINDIYYDQSNKIDLEILGDASKWDLRARRGLMQQGVNLMVGVNTMRSAFVRVIDFLDLSDLTQSMSYSKNLESNIKKFRASAGITELEVQKGDIAFNYHADYVSQINEYIAKVEEHDMLAQTAIQDGTYASAAVIKMMGDISNAVTNENALAVAQSNFTQILALIISALAVLIGVLIAFITVKSITRPISQMVSVARGIADGNLDIGNLTHRSRDEIGELVECMQNMSAVITDLISEMNRMSFEHDLGDVESKVDEDRFSGSYKDVAAKINSMIGGYLKHIQDMCDVLGKFGLGDFDAEYMLLPGKKAMMNSVIETLRQNLKDISGEIDSLAAAAVAGKLDARADFDKFQGGWGDLLRSLNDVMDAVIAPIHEASSVMRAMSSGDLKLKVTGNYNGDFAIIKTSLNSTQEAIYSYITEISEILTRLSNQDLTACIDRDYIGDFSIIKDSINMIIATFNDVLSDISINAEQVRLGSKQLAESSLMLSQGSMEQADAVEKLNASVDTVAKRVSENAITSERANELAMSTRESAQIGNDEIKDMIVAMEGINESSKNISKIIKIIQDIAFQTNLLALNAAVEAARAGQYGKGFAVVAQEVRNLASRSHNAAEDTTALIEGSMKKVAEGSDITNKTAETLGVIIDQISEIASYMQTITDASKAQIASIEDINKEVDQVSQVMVSNTSISQQGAASSQQMASQADLFKSTVAKFKLRVK